MDLLVQGYTNKKGKFIPFNVYKKVPKNLKINAVDNVKYYHPIADYLQNDDYSGHVYDKENYDKKQSHFKHLEEAKKLGVKSNYYDDDHWIEFNNKQTFHNVDKLKQKFGDNVVFVHINKYDNNRPILEKSVPRVNFAFDYAVGGLTNDQKKELEQAVKDYRNEKVDDPNSSIGWNERVMIRLANIGKIAEKGTVVQGIFS